MEEEKKSTPPPHYPATPVFDPLEPITEEESVSRTSTNSSSVNHPLHRCNAIRLDFTDGTWKPVGCPPIITDDPAAVPTLSLEPSLSYDHGVGLHSTDNPRGRFVNKLDHLARQSENAPAATPKLSFVSHNHVLARFSLNGIITSDDLKKLIMLPVAITAPSCLLQLRIKCRNIYSQVPTNDIAAVVSVGQACCDERYVRHFAICGTRPCDYERDIVVAWDCSMSSQLLEIRISNIDNVLRTLPNEDKEICIIFEGYTFIE